MEVADFRLSCIWTESVRDAFGATSRGRMDALMQSDLYGQLFNAILDSDGDQLLAVPWPAGPKGPFPLSNAYWRKYILNALRGGPPGKRGEAAFRALVPFKRKTALVRVKYRDRCFVEAWYHPHGVVLIVTAWFRGSFTPDALENAVHDFTHERLAATWSDGVQQSAKLEEIADAGLDRLRREAFGEVGLGFRPDPLRILTVVSAQPGPNDDDPDAGLRAIAASAAAAVGGQIVGKPADTPSDIQTLTKGRVICNRRKAMAPRRKTHTLGCLHRNVTIATAQVASLLSGVEAALAALEEADNAMYPRVEDYFRQLAQQLEVIHTGASDDTYAQPCVQSQTKEAAALINRLRAVIPLAPLP